MNKTDFFKAVATGLVLLTAISVSYAGRGMGYGSSSEEFTPPSGAMEQGMEMRGGGDIGALIISEGTEFTVTGTVVSGDAIRALTLSTTELGELSIHGIGPAAYWESLGYSVPEVDDTITVFGYSVELNENTVYIAFSVEITDADGNAVTVPLRDENGTPVAGPMGEREPLDITSGEPFTFEEVTVIEASEGFRTPTVVATNDGEVSVALGPQFYWESLALSKPAIDEVITVTGYTVTTDREDMPTFNIAASVTLGNGTVVTLLDDEGKPVWVDQRGGRF